MVYQRRRFATINQLKQAIVTEWDKLLQRFIDRAIGQWRRLSLILKNVLLQKSSCFQLLF